MTTVSGNPNYYIALGSGGTFAVKDASSSFVFSVSDTGKVIVHDEIFSSSAAVKLVSGATNPYLTLVASASAMDFRFHSGSGRHEIEVDAAYLRLDSYGIVELQGGHAAADIVTVHGGSSGDKVLTITYDSSNDRVAIISSTVSSTAQKLKLSSPSTLELEGDAITLESSGSGPGEIARLARDSDDRLKVFTDSGVVRVETLKTSGGALVDDLDLKAEKITLSTDATTGTITQFRSGSTGNRLEVYWNDTDDESIIRAISPSEQLRPDLVLTGPTDVRAIIDDEGYGGDTYFRVQKNISTTLRTAFEVGWNSASAEFRSVWWDSTGNAIMQVDRAQPGRPTVDLAIAGGGACRGLVRIHPDAANSRMGLLQLWDEANDGWYIWCNSDGQMRMSHTADDDPNTNTDDGYLVAGVPLPIHNLTTGSYTITQSDSGTVFTNSGASGDVDFTLPTWIQGLRYSFVCRDAGDNFDVVAPTGVYIRVGSESTSSGGTMRADVVGSAMTLVATESGYWDAIGSSGDWTGS